MQIIFFIVTYFVTVFFLYAFLCSRLKKMNKEYNELKKEVQEKLEETVISVLPRVDCGTEDFYSANALISIKDKPKLSNFGETDINEIINDEHIALYEKFKKEKPVIMHTSPEARWSFPNQKENFNTKTNIGFVHIVISCLIFIFVVLLFFNFCNFILNYIMG